MIGHIYLLVIITEQIFCIFSDVCLIFSLSQITNKSKTIKKNMLSNYDVFIYWKKNYNRILLKNK